MANFPFHRGSCSGGGGAGDLPGDRPAFYSHLLFLDFERGVKALIA